LLWGRNKGESRGVEGKINGETQILERARARDMGVHFAFDFGFGLGVFGEKGFAYEYSSTRTMGGYHFLYDVAPWDCLDIGFLDTEWIFFPSLNRNGKRILPRRLQYDFINFNFVQNQPNLLRIWYPL
jgi:hypothetical protein